MTFGNLILRLRERLGDMRKSDSSAITAISQDGIRWTSASLIDISNSAISETIRLISIYKTNNLMLQQLYSMFGIIYPTTISIINGDGTITEPILYVSELSVNDKLYAYITPEKYLFYKTQKLSLLKDELFFTIVFDSLNNTKILKLLPITSGTITANVTCIYTKSDYTVADGAINIGLRNMDDLILDIAEREACDREHNHERSLILDKRIGLKLGVNISFNNN